MMAEVSPRTTALQQACEETRGKGAKEQRMSPGKKCNYRQVQDAILKANPSQRLASLISNTDPAYPQPEDGHTSS